jgi:Fe2+ transport system protein FeoA
MTPNHQLHSAPTVLPLDQVAEHSCVLIHHVEASDDDMRRLMTMGICGGRRIELVQHGDPMILKVFGSRLGVSRRLAARVLVCICEKTDCPLETR